MIETSLPSTVTLGAEVRAALQDGRPVVALESAVITHGLPAPHHLAAVASMEQAIRARDAVPAVCLVAGGTLHIGADSDLIAAVGNDPAREKASVRELGLALAAGVSAGLTVSATLFAAQLAGIHAFATGGIGGVHLGVEETGDISADLPQLARSPVVTVCAGAKSVLDLPRTLEYLETMGVPVVGYRTATFPAFYLRSSGLPVRSLDSPAAIAAAARAAWDLGLAGGMIVGNPLPEEDAIRPEQWERWLTEAREAARREEIRGKDVTPYLLAHVAGASGGETVRANIALLTSNAALAAEIAGALAG